MTINDSLEYSLTEIVNEFLKQAQEAKRQLGQFNIIIIGKAGVGKSTIINNIFGKDLAITGCGKPITKEIVKHITPGCPIIIYDTPGLELDQTKADTVKTGVAKIIKDNKSLAIEEHIHIVWYCVSNNSERFEKSEEDWIKTLSQEDEVPVIIVLTQTNDPKLSNFLDHLRKLNLPVNSIVPIMAQAKEITSIITLPAYGLKDLVEETAKLIPEQAERAFIHQQVANINVQAIQADKYLIGYVAGSAILAAAPVPTIEFGALLSLQLAMLAHITVIFGLEFDEKFYSILTTSIAGTATTTDIGKALIINLLKWIPGANYATTAVTAAIAATMTLSLGRASIEAIQWYKIALAKDKEVSSKRLADRIVEMYKKYTGSRE